MFKIIVQPFACHGWSMYLDVFVFVGTAVNFVTNDRWFVNGFCYMETTSSSVGFGLWDVV